MCIRDRYYVKEIEAPKGYVKSDKIFDVDASYPVSYTHLVSVGSKFTGYVPGG